MSHIYVAFPLRANLNVSEVFSEIVMCLPYNEGISVINPLAIATQYQHMTDVQKCYDTQFIPYIVKAVW